MKIKFNLNIVLNTLIGSFFVVTIIYGLLVPVTSDAGKYAAISRIMYETGDWMNLQIHFEPYMQKPPLLFWITAPFFHLFGPSVFAFKLPVLLFSLIAFYSTYCFAKLYYGEKTAFLATLFLATSEFYFLFHNDVHMDTLLTANVIFAVWQLAKYFKSKKLTNLLLASCGVGLAMISKGPIGIFVPATAAFTHLVFTKKLKILISYKTLLAGATVLLILVIGLAGLFSQFGWYGLYFFFWENNAGRITGALKGNNTDYLFYFHTALYIFIPWGFIFFLALFYEFKDFFKQKWKTESNYELFALGGLTFYWIILSFARAKAPHYLTVVSPFMAVISAKWLLRFFHGSTPLKIKKTINVLQYVVIVGLWILLFALCVYAFPTTSVFFWMCVVVLFTLLFIPFKMEKLTILIVRSVITIVALNFALNVHVFPQLFKYQSVVQACTIFNEQADDLALLNTYLSEHRELFFYAKNPGYFLYSSEDLQKRLSQKGDWIYTNDKGLEEINKSGAKIELVASFKHRSMSKFTAKFMNPATRNQTLKNMHLIKIIVPQDG